MILPIFAYGHPVLKTKAKKIDKDFKDLFKFKYPNIYYFGKF